MTSKDQNKKTKKKTGRDIFKEKINKKADPDKFLSLSESEHKKLAVERIYTELQVRNKFEEKRLESLAESIKEHGLQQEIVVKKDGERYKVVVGERRFRAIKDILKWSKIDCRVSQISEEAIPVIQLIENLQREDLSPEEEAMGILYAKEKANLNNRELSAQIGLSEVYISKMLKVAELLKEYPDNKEFRELSKEALYEISKAKNKNGIINEMLEKIEKKTNKDIDNTSSLKEKSIKDLLPTTKELRAKSSGKKPKVKFAIIKKEKYEIDQIELNVEFKTKGLSEQENKELKDKGKEISKIVREFAELPKESRKIKIQIQISK